MRVTCRAADRRRNLLILAFALGAAVPAGAQVPASADGQASAVTPAEDPTVTPSEDIEPRIIGAPGTTSLGFSGYADTVRSADEVRPFNLSLHVDVTRFLTAKIAVRGGVAGSATFGGDPDDLPEGVGMPALHAFGAGLYYFTPRSMASFYAGAGYWAQITARDGPDNGFVIGLGGLEAAVSSRALVFVEGGYGFGLSRTTDGSTRQRLVGRVGVRLKL
jgi:hypothetical protein